MVFIKNILLLLAIPAVLVLTIAILHIGAILAVQKKSIELNKADLIIAFPSENERLLAALALAEKGYGSNLSVINITSNRLKTLTNNYNIAPEVQLITGGISRSTFEDVFRASRIIRENRCNSLVLVTSSYHIPRSMFLLKTFLKISGMKVKVQYYPVNTLENYDRTKKLKTYYNELVKLWGSTVEMVCYGLTKKLPADIKGFNRAMDFYRTYLLFKI